MTADVKKRRGNFKNFDRTRSLRRLLLISCSKRKRPAPGLLPAIDRYDGPAFRVLRRYLRERQDPSLIVCILSAEFGLISSRTPIRDYDRLMTAARARELRVKTTSRLGSVLRLNACAELFVCASMDYELALAWPQLCALASVRFAARGQGAKLMSLRRWLRRKSE